MATKINTPPNKSWVQVTDDALNCSKDSTVMVRTYKLPTHFCRNILDYIKIGMTPSAVELWLSGVVGSLDDGGVTGSNFVPATGETFGLNSYQLQQIEAGEYMLLKCRYEYTGINIQTIPEKEPWQKEVSESWQVGWQTYSVSPYIYCDEVAHTDKLINSDGTEVPASGNHACRQHIETTINQPSTRKGLATNASLYIRTNNAYKAELTTAEKAIMDKVLVGVNPTFHKPIVTCTKVWKTNRESALPDPQGNIDRIGWPGGAIAQGWTGTFIYCGMSYTKTKQDIITIDPEDDSQIKTVTIYTLNVVDTWEGALKPDEDFYGVNAWEFGKGPCDDVQQGQEQQQAQNS